MGLGSYCACTKLNTCPLVSVRPVVRPVVRSVVVVRALSVRPVVSVLSSPSSSSVHLSVPSTLPLSSAFVRRPSRRRRPPGSIVRHVDVVVLSPSVPSCPSRRIRPVVVVVVLLLCLFVRPVVVVVIPCPSFVTSSGDVEAAQFMRMGASIGRGVRVGVFGGQGECILCVMRVFLRVEGV